MNFVDRMRGARPPGAGACRRLAWAGALLCVAGVLAACGQKGPLWVPGHGKDTPWPMPPAEGGPNPAARKTPADGATAPPSPAAPASAPAAPAASAAAASAAPASAPAPASPPSPAPAPASVPDAEPR